MSPRHHAQAFWACVQALPAHRLEEAWGDSLCVRTWKRQMRISSHHIAGQRIRR